MSDLDELREAVEAQYNDAISVYDYDDFIRVTNGSGAHMIDVRFQDDYAELVGRRYGEGVEKTCAPTIEAVLETLSSTI